MDENERLNNIDGTVQAVVYRNEENGYSVIRLKTDDGETVTATGCIPGACAGERMSLVGAWASHPSYGRQLRILNAERFLPTDAGGIFDYLAAGAVSGIGPATAAALVKKFGDETLYILENDVSALTQIRGISPKRAAEMSASFKKQMGLRRLMEYLGGYGVSPMTAIRLYRRFGDGARAAVEAEPYLIAEESLGGDFFEADKFALSLGYAPDGEARIKAAILFEMQHNISNGHTFLPADKLCAAAERLIGVTGAAAALDSLAEEGSVVREVVSERDAVYLPDMYAAEDSAAHKLLSLAVDRPTRLPNVEALINRAERAQGIKYAELQRKAVELAAKNRVLVLTGGPGTGKTTCVRGILAMFDAMGLDTALTAPTGRAAKRMTELAGREAVTVHRLLGASYAADGERTIFSRDDSDPLTADAVILDEASMIDICLFSALLDALRPGCRLIMVGDADQLPSVGPGNVFSEVIRSDMVPVVRLTEIFRQAGESAIVKNAHMINSGELPDLKANGGGFFFLRRKDPDRAAQTIVELCAQRLPANMGIPPQEIQVLCPYRKKRCGVENLNVLLRRALNPQAEGRAEARGEGGLSFRVGDRVMQIKNNYELPWRHKELPMLGAGVYNGDIGYIAEIDPAAEIVTVDFDGRLAQYGYDRLGELELAYAMTVHKSQGSEYRAVVLAVTGESDALLTRGVLYTSVTRAKDMLVIVGDDEAVARMVRDDRRARRYSGLRARLAGDIG